MHDLHGTVSSCYNTKSAKISLSITLLCCSNNTDINNEGIRIMTCWKHALICCRFCVCTLVVGNSLVDPAAKVGHTCIHSRCAHVAVGSAPGHNTNEGPDSTARTDQRATRITLKREKHKCLNDFK